MLDLVTICCKLLKVRLLPDWAISSTENGLWTVNGVAVAPKLCVCGGGGGGGRGGGAKK